MHVRHGLFGLVVALCLLSKGSSWFILPVDSGSRVGRSLKQLCLSKHLVHDLVTRLSPGFWSWCGDYVVFVVWLPGLLLGSLVQNSF